MATRLVPTVLLETAADDFDPSGLEGQFSEGDLVELELLLDPDLLTEGEEPRVQEALSEMEHDLLVQGVRRWPGESRLIFLDWPNRSASIRFQYTTSVIAAHVPQAIVAIPFFTILFGLLRSAAAARGLTLLPRVVTGLVTLLRRIPFFITLLGGALLIWALLQVIKVVKWVIENIVIPLGKSPGGRLLLGAIAFGAAYLVGRRVVGERRWPIIER